MCKDLKALPAAKYTDVKPGFTIFPRTAFNIANPDEPVDVYFSAAAQITDNLKNFVSVDVAQRFHEVFRDINNNQPVEVLNGPNDTKFVPVNFRLMTPEVGAKATSLIHNGANVTARCVNTYQHLKGLMDFDNQLSFFCIIQNCVEGGDITIYDFPRDEYPNISDFRYLEKDGKRIDLETTKDKCTVHMKPGDLIVFPGGQLWHRVDIIKKGQRISLGGFATDRYSDNNWFYWT